ncbi:MAG: hypothetical protein ACLQFI_02735 [Methylocella sp.]
MYRDPNSGLLLAAEMGPEGKTIILPQIVVVFKEGAGETAITGPNHNDVREFLARLQNVLADEVILIEKRKEGFEVAYQTTPLTWTDEAYMAGESKSSSSAPKEGLWLEPLTRPETASNGERLPFAVFALPKGQLVCRGESPALASALLTFLRQNPQIRSTDQVDATTSSDDAPGVHLGFNFDMAAYDRVLTKIGLNLVAKLLGVAFVRNVAFDSAVDYARNGVGGVYKVEPTAAASLESCLGPAIADRHVMGLFERSSANGTHALVFVIRLYGGPFEVYRLAEFDRAIAGLETPILVHVDYANHKIERLDLEGHVLKVVQEHGDWTRPANGGGSTNAK